ncbi:hypothetical protein NQ784_18395, partial [Acinetobacter baumannii]|nr:hypothetical protein [Acinetobacter baumannii]
MSEKTKFTKREWLLSIIILLIIEAFIFWVAFQFAGNSSALGYVSFAGTLISIILAVLAIGYTYGESHQQKNSSITLGNQIDSLIKIKERLEVQTNALEDIKILKDSLNEFSEKVESHFNETKVKLNEFNETMLAQPTNKESNEEIKTPIIELSDEYKEFIFKKYMQSTYVVSALSLILSVLFFENRKKYLDGVFNEQFLQDLDINNLVGDSKSIFAGSTFQTALFLQVFGFQKKDTNYLHPLVLNHFNFLLNKNDKKLGDYQNGLGQEIIEKAKQSKYYK